MRRFESEHAGERVGGESGRGVYGGGSDGDGGSHPAELAERVLNDAAAAWDGARAAVAAIARGGGSSTEVASATSSPSAGDPSSPTLTATAMDSDDEEIAGGMLAGLRARRKEVETQAAAARARRTVAKQALRRKQRRQAQRKPLWSRPVGVEQPGLEPLLLRLTAAARRQSNGLSGKVVRLEVQAGDVAEAATLIVLHPASEATAANARGGAKAAAALAATGAAIPLSTGALAFVERALARSYEVQAACEASHDAARVDWERRAESVSAARERVVDTAALKAGAAARRRELRQKASRGELSSDAMAMLLVEEQQLARRAAADSESNIAPPPPPLPLRPFEERRFAVLRLTLCNCSRQRLFVSGGGGGGGGSAGSETKHYPFGVRSLAPGAVGHGSVAVAVALGLSGEGHSVLLDTQFLLSSGCVVSAAAAGDSVGGGRSRVLTLRLSWGAVATAVIPTAHSDGRRRNSGSDGGAAERRRRRAALNSATARGACGPSGVATLGARGCALVTARRGVLVTASVSGSRSDDEDLAEYAAKKGEADSAHHVVLNDALAGAAETFDEESHAQPSSDAKQNASLPTRLRGVCYGSGGGLHLVYVVEEDDRTKAASSMLGASVQQVHARGNASQQEPRGLVAEEKDAMEEADSVELRIDVPIIEARVFDSAIATLAPFGGGREQEGSYGAAAAAGKGGTAAKHLAGGGATWASDRGALLLLSLERARLRFLAARHITVMDLSLGSLSVRDLRWNSLFPVAISAALDADEVTRPKPMLSLTLGLSHRPTTHIVGGHALTVESSGGAVRYGRENAASAERISLSSRAYPSHDDVGVNEVPRSAANNPSIMEPLAASWWSAIFGGVSPAASARPAPPLPQSSQRRSGVASMEHAASAPAARDQRGNATAYHYRHQRPTSSPNGQHSPMHTAAVKASSRALSVGASGAAEVGARSIAYFFVRSIALPLLTHSLRSRSFCRSGLRCSRLRCASTTHCYAGSSASTVLSLRSKRRNELDVATAMQRSHSHELGCLALGFSPESVEAHS